MIPRIVDIAQNLEAGKVLIIYGPRQVGKTTLVKAFLSQSDLKAKVFSGDELAFAEDFSKCDLRLIKNILGDAQLLVIDEAQKIDQIGRALKLVVDHMPELYVIATGSSSFDLANAMDEPLTGRKNVISLYPIAVQELMSQNSVYEMQQKLSEFLIYGMYPNIITYETADKKQNRITEIKDSYLIKDILEFHKVKKSNMVIKLLKLLAFQIGSEVSTFKLGAQLGLDNKTIARYLELLEKSFVLVRLDGFSRNLRKEISKMSKYYFYDLGIRNALISNFNDLETRNDVGELWENFMLIERMKSNAYQKCKVNYYFWRTYDQKEIDLIEERDGKLCGYEFKWQKDKAAVPPDWLRAYPEASYEVITHNNAFDFLENS